MKLSTTLSIALILSSTLACQAITNTAIAVSGTNLILSWPSRGYETYLVQYRQTLDATDSWSIVTNAYPANSTNFTTFTLYGLVPLPASSGGGGNGNLVGVPPGPSFANRTTMATSSEPMVMSIDGSGRGVPLALYPPGSDLSSFDIFYPATGETVSGSLYSQARTANPNNPIFNRPQPMDGGSGGTDTQMPEPQTGFYRVFHIPNFLANFSGHTFNGPTFISVDYASPDAPVDYVDNTTVLINGQPTDNATFMPYIRNGVTNWGVGIYFDRFPNGTNTLQLLTTVRESDTLNDQTPYMVFSNAPTAITIGNSIMFTNWSELVLGGTYTFQAQSSLSNVNWEIDIYDVYDNFVNYQTGYSADGNISWTWDMTDYNGYSRSDDSDPFFFPYITVTQNSGSISQSGGVHPNTGGSSASSWTPPLANQFPSVADWIFTYMDNFYTDGTTNYPGANSSYLTAISRMSGGPSLWDIGFLYIPLKYGTIYSQTNRDQSWDSLKSWLKSWNNRNLYYFGHGSADTIGGDVNELDSSNNITGAKGLRGSNAMLNDQWVHDNVTFNKTWGPMPFRFVYLDGCNTASGGWSEAWGVPKQVETIDYYRSAANTIGKRPSAFVGWDVEIGGSKEWGTIDKFWQFRQFWMANWSVETSTETLKQAFDDALTGSSWVDNGHYSHLKIYGYQDMRFLEFNHAGDWQQ